MTELLDEGPFFHGTVADLRVGDLLTAGYRSNYRPEVVMNHIYFTALWTAPDLLLNRGGARRRRRSPACLCRRADRDIRERPERDRQEISRQPTRSYRSSAPIKVVGEITHWTRLTLEALQMWRERLTKLRTDERGEIIN